MSFSFHPESEEEFNKAIEYYENEEIFVIAIMNLHRDPDYWKHRK